MAIFKGNLSNSEDSKNKWQYLKKDLNEILTWPRWELVYRFGCWDENAVEMRRKVDMHQSQIKPALQLFVYP
jgi:uncharacterized membrane protein